jgi:hypothetical protein
LLRLTWYLNGFAKANWIYQLYMLWVKRIMFLPSVRVVVANHYKSSTLFVIKTVMWSMWSNPML